MPTGLLTELLTELILPIAVALGAIVLAVFALGPRVPRWFPWPVFWALVVVVVVVFLFFLWARLVTWF